jgi:hypothetical protein
MDQNQLIAKIQTEQDIVVQFQCGHYAFNPKSNDRNDHGSAFSYRCPVCNARRRVIESWVQCRNKGCAEIIHRGFNGKTYYCETCRVAIRKERRNRINEAHKSTIGAMDFACTLNEVADELGITHEGARQLQNRAIAKFKRRWRALFGDETLFDRVFEAEDLRQERWSYGGMG